jgi:hypothetical protein
MERLHRADLLFGLFLNFEDVDGVFLGNVGLLSAKYKVSYPRRSLQNGAGSVISYNFNLLNSNILNPSTEKYIHTGTETISYFRLQILYINLG